MKIIVPRSLDLENAIGFTNYLAKLDASDRFLFDFRDMARIEPFGMLIVSSELRRLRARFPESEIACENFGDKKYASHMGFFQAFGLEHGNYPGEARGSISYIPLTICNCEDIERRAAEKGTYAGDIIEQKSEKLVEVLLHSGSTEIKETLSYSLREIMRNVVEHSGATQFGICAQAWPSKNLVEFAIIDRGIGLQQSLSSNPHLEVVSDKSAINYALMPAVSGKAFKGAPRQRKGPWSNSGFGLYMTSRISRNGGNFFIASGDTGMLLTAKGGKKYFNCSYNGTAVRMVINTDQVEELGKSLELYRKEGFEIQRTYKEIVNIDPSSASLMLSKDFDLSLWQKLLATLKGK